MINQIKEDNQVITKPPIAVLMPAYNAEAIIHKAIDSLNKNPQPHDIIVVDDGSRNLLSESIPPQSNLIIIRAAQNGGITKALNLGVEYIVENNYKYLARLDADDEAMPDRLKQQYEFMEQNPDVALCGTWGEVVTESGETLFHLNHPATHPEIMKRLNYNSQFLHPSLMIRVESLKKLERYYSEDYPSAEDYELVRYMAKQGKLANIPQYLIRYTYSSGGISHTKRKQQLLTRLKVQLAYKNLLSPHFYAGIAKTLCLLVLPMELVTSLKMKIKAYRKN